MRLPHFLHLPFLGLGHKHQEYTLIMRSGGLLHIFNSHGEEETDQEILSAFQRYFDSLSMHPANGEHKLDYDVSRREFHGLGTRHTKYRIVRPLPERILMYDMQGQSVEEGDAFNALNTILGRIDVDQIPVGSEGFQVDYDESRRAWRGFEGGDSGGAGANSDFTPVAVASKTELFAGSAGRTLGDAADNSVPGGDDQATVSAAPDTNAQADDSSADRATTADSGTAVACEPPASTTYDAPDTQSYDAPSSGFNSDN
jgi:hypothetical protein